MKSKDTQRGEKKKVFSILEGIKSKPDIMAEIQDIPPKPLLSLTGTLSVKISALPQVCPFPQAN